VLFGNAFIWRIPYVISLHQRTGDDNMSESWVQDCKALLDRIKKREDTKERDRLEVVASIRFILFALQRSVSGWADWVNNPDTMARFSLEELKEMSENLAKLTQSFIEYDCEITSHSQQGMAIREPEAPNEPSKKAKDKAQTFYVK
jgi:hypothetical protein